MKKNKRQQINITEKDADIIFFLEQKPNISQYVIGLVRKDMSANNEEFREKVIKIIEDYYGKSKTTTSLNNQENLYDAIQNVFGL